MPIVTLQKNSKTIMIRKTPCTPINNHKMVRKICVQMSLMLTSFELFMLLMKEHCLGYFFEHFQSKKPSPHDNYDLSHAQADSHRKSKIWQYSKINEIII